MDAEKKINSDLAGIQAAYSAVLRALIETHPDKQALLAAMRFHHQETLALMTAAPIPDRALETFQMAWMQFGPVDRDG